MAKAKILIVEDEAITARDLQNRLEDLGYDAPAIAASGAEAIKKAEEIRPDMVVMDIVLKGDIDGIDAAEQIRDRFDIPVVYLTAYIDEERLEKTRVTEPYGYIIKPFENKELRTAIEMALQRHTLERALRNSEQDWRTSFNSLDDVMLIINKDYTIENINEIGLKLLGKSKEEVIGQKCYQVISGGDSPGEDCPCMKSLETKKVESVDRYEERFGKYYSIKSSPIFDENGEIIKCVDFRRDITERKKAEEELRKNEAKFRVLLENLPQKIFLKDKHSTYISCNENYARDLRINPDEIAGKTDYDFFPKELAEKYRGDDKRIMELGRIEELEERYIQDGQEVWVSTIKTPVKDKKGNTIGIFGIFWDITERKRAEDTLKSYQFMVESAHDAIFFKDLKSQYNIANEKTLEVFGRSRDEVIGKTDYELMPNKEEAKKNLDDDQVVFKTGKPTEIIKHMTRADGVGYWFQAVKVPHFDAAGNVTGLIGIARDITERKRAEDAIMKKSEELKRFNKLAVGRELKMIELKKEINALLEQLGKEPRYKIAEEGLR